MPSTIGTMAWNETGDWRFLTPLITDKLLPAARTVRWYSDPSYLNALRNVALKEVSPVAGPQPVAGRLATMLSPLSDKMYPEKVDQAISVQKIERFLADIGTEVKIEKSKTADKRVVVIGSGPLVYPVRFI